jgi:hypothetical protein
MTKFTKWVLWNGTQLTLTCLWLFAGLEWAGNLVRFYLVVVLVLSLVFVLTAPKESKAFKEVQKEGRSVSKQLSITIDLITICLLASQGEFWFAAIALGVTGLESYVFDKTPTA